MDLPSLTPMALPAMLMALYFLIWYADRYDRDDRRKRKRKPPTDRRRSRLNRTGK